MTDLVTDSLTIKATSPASKVSRSRLHTHTLSATQARCCFRLLGYFCSPTFCTIVPVQQCGMRPCTGESLHVLEMEPIVLFRTGFELELEGIFRSLRDCYLVFAHCRSSGVRPYNYVQGIEGRSSARLFYDEVRTALVSYSMTVCLQGDKGAGGLGQVTSVWLGRLVLC